MKVSEEGEPLGWDDHMVDNPPGGPGDEKSARLDKPDGHPVLNVFQVVGLSMLLLAGFALAGWVIFR